MTFLKIKIICLILWKENSCIKNTVTNIEAFEVNGFRESYIYRFKFLNDIIILERLSARAKDYGGEYIEYGTVTKPLNNCSGEPIKRNYGKILC